MAKSFKLGTPKAKTFNRATPPTGIKGIPKGTTGGSAKVGKFPANAAASKRGAGTNIAK